MSKSVENADNIDLDLRPTTLQLLKSAKAWIFLIFQVLLTRCNGTHDMVYSQGGVEQATAANPDSFPFPM